MPANNRIRWIVQQFEPNNTKAWRTRSVIITALDNISDLADEASKCLDSRNTLRQANIALKDLAEHLEVLWPGIRYPEGIINEQLHRQPAGEGSRARVSAATVHDRNG